MLSFFPRDILDEILNVIESVSEIFPFYSFNGSNTFGTMKISSRQGKFDLMSVNHSARSGGIIGIHFRFS